MRPCRPSTFWHLAANAIAGWIGAPLGLDGLALRRLVSPQACICLVAAVRRWRRRPRRPGPGRVAPPLAMALAALVAYWLTLMIGKGLGGQALRLTLCVHREPSWSSSWAVELLAGHRVTVPVARAVAASPASPRLTNTVVLLHFGAKRRHDAAVVRAQVGALELARRGRAGATSRSTTTTSKRPVSTPGPYFTGTRELGIEPRAGRLAGSRPHRRGRPRCRGRPARARLRGGAAAREPGHSRACSSPVVSWRRRLSDSSSRRTPSSARTAVAS